MRKKRDTKLYTKKVATKAVKKASVKAGKETILEQYCKTVGKALGPNEAKKVLLSYIVQNPTLLWHWLSITANVITNYIPMRVRNKHDGIYTWYASFARSSPSRKLLTPEQLKELSQLTIADLISILPDNTNTH